MGSKWGGGGLQTKHLLVVKLHIWVFGLTRGKKKNTR